MPFCFPPHLQSVWQAAPPETESLSYEYIIIIIYLSLQRIPTLLFSVLCSSFGTFFFSSIFSFSFFCVGGHKIWNHSIEPARVQLDIWSCGGCFTYRHRGLPLSPTLLDRKKKKKERRKNKNDDQTRKINK
eukprot:gene7853-5480_t